MCGRATPRIANWSGRWPDSARLYIAGNSFRRVRSPDAPKMTSTQASARGLDMAAELGAERRQDLFRERVILPRAEALEERRREHVGRHRLFDRGLDGPAPFTRVGDVADEPRQLGIGGKCARGQIEQPRADDAAAPPELGDRREI